MRDELRKIIETYNVMLKKSDEYLNLKILSGDNFSWLHEVAFMSNSLLLSKS